MIVVVRSITSVTDKAFQALAWANEADAVLSRVLGRAIKHAVGFGGQVGRLAYIIEYDSLAHYEQQRTKLLQDRDYQALVAKTEGLFVSGSCVDEIWRVG